MSEMGFSQCALVNNPICRVTLHHLADSFVFGSLIQVSLFRLVRQGSRSRKLNSNIPEVGMFLYCVITILFISF